MKMAGSVFITISVPTALLSPDPSGLQVLSLSPSGMSSQVVYSLHQGTGMTFSQSNGCNQTVFPFISLVFVFLTLVSFHLQWPKQSSDSNPIFRKFMQRKEEKAREGEEREKERKKETEQLYSLNTFHNFSISCPVCKTILMFLPEIFFPNCWKTL